MSTGSTLPAVLPFLLGIPTTSDGEGARSDSIRWVTPDGVVWDWPCGFPAGVEGRGVPPLKIDERDILGDGVSMGAQRFVAREIFIPFAMTDTPEQLRRTSRAWAAALAADRRLGKIRIGSVLNDEREISCRYSGGFELTEEDQSWLAAGVTFRAPHPFWEDAAETILEWAAANETTNFFPIPNPTTGSFITLSQGNVITIADVTNGGDMEAWPIWEITGPGSGSIKLVHLATGQTIAFSRSLAPGETITIDTRPGVKTVQAADGANEFGALGLSELFPLSPGANSISLAIGGAELGTVVKLRFRRQWLMA